MYLPVSVSCDAFIYSVISPLLEETASTLYVSVQDLNRGQMNVITFDDKWVVAHRKPHHMMEGGPHQEALINNKKKKCTHITRTNTGWKRMKTGW